MAPAAATPLPRCAATEPAVATGAAGWIHSLTAGSMVDGPGVRTVVWTTGCQLRCVYCHNPDTWAMQSGSPTPADGVVRAVHRYRTFMRAASGGMTLSGGEPLVQARFAARVLRGCQELGIHTALDTNGFLGDRLSDAELALADLVILDLKSFDEEAHRRATGGFPVEPVLRFARRLADLGRPAWLRFVLVPGLTDDPGNVDALAGFAATLPNVERVEVKPFHQLGRSKWARLGMPYELEDVAPPSPAAVARAVQSFRARGLTVV